MTDIPPPENPGPPPPSTPGYGQQDWGQQPAWQPQPAYVPAGIVPGQMYAVTSDERTMGMLAHLLGLVAGFLGPLVILLTKGKESAYVKHQATESLNFQITLAIGYFVSFILMFVLIGFLTIFAVLIIHYVYGIIATIKANQGIAYRYPINIRLVS
jgi:uncharacterized Tic20 family protein